MHLPDPVWLILGLELVNTAVEAVVDLASEDYHPLAKKAKDTAAGAVLIAAIAAAVIGVIIFGPNFWQCSAYIKSVKKYRKGV